MLFQIEYEWTANGKKQRAEFVVNARNLGIAEEMCREIRPDIPEHTEAKGVNWLHNGIVAL